MAFFSFTDIKFRNEVRNFSPQSLTGNSRYETNILRYPIDVGNTDKGHYMVIHVNEQIKSAFARNDNTGDVPSVFTRKGNNVAGAVNNVLGALNSNLKINTNFVRTIRRTSETIALYMPDTLAFRNDQQYSGLQLTGLAAAGLAGGSGALSDIEGMMKSFSGDPKMLGEQLLKMLGSNLSPFVANFIKNDPLGQAAIASTGKVINPLLEMIYSSPDFRTFNFDFMLYPRDEKEATEVQSIISTLQFHQAPEISDVGGLGFFLVPPSEFDIKFYYNGAQNPNIPQISTCVLTSIEVDYAPSGWSAYEVEGNVFPSIGKTGMPVAIRLGLQFKETEIVTKEWYRKTFTERSQAGEFGTT
jgi:hypothetical protein